MNVMDGDVLEPIGILITIEMNNAPELKGNQCMYEVFWRFSRTADSFKV